MSASRQTRCSQFLPSSLLPVLCTFMYVIVTGRVHADAVEIQRCPPSPGGSPRSLQRGDGCSARHFSTIAAQLAGSSLSPTQTCLSDKLSFFRGVTSVIRKILYQTYFETYRASATKNLSNENTSLKIHTRPGVDWSLQLHQVCGRRCRRLSRLLLAL